MTFQVTTPSRGADTRTWEDAYLRFETPEEEVRKFLRRLSRLGAARWSRDWVILDLFSGRGGGCEALRRIGFKHVFGVDMSERLLRQTHERHSRIVGDCTRLPIGSAVVDVAIVQGGLHHLPRLPDDLAITLAEVGRVLRPGGLFVIVEPWRTPFLDVVHFVSRTRLARVLSPKIDALATMIRHERVTYEQWLAAPGAILTAIQGVFRILKQERRLGKLYLSAAKAA